jgi:predicted DNA-binding ribbon-helix-helix protein
MHRTQVMLEEHQYRRLKRESENSGRSIGELVREAIDEKYGRSQERMWAALEASWGAWADRDDIGDGAEYVERIRNQSIDDRMKQLGWD